MNGDHTAALIAVGKIARRPVRLMQWTRVIARRRGDNSVGLAPPKLRKRYPTPLTLSLSRARLRQGTITDSPQTASVPAPTNAISAVTVAAQWTQSVIKKKLLKERHTAHAAAGQPPHTSTALAARPRPCRFSLPRGLNEVRRHKAASPPAMPGPATPQFSLDRPPSAALRMGVI